MIGTGSLSPSLQIRIPPSRVNSSHLPNMLGRPLSSAAYGKPSSLPKVVGIFSKMSLVPPQVPRITHRHVPPEHHCVFVPSKVQWNRPSFFSSVVCCLFPFPRFRICARLDARFLTLAGSLFLGDPFFARLFVSVRRILRQTFFSI